MKACAIFQTIKKCFFLEQISPRKLFICVLLHASIQKQSKIYFIYFGRYQMPHSMKLEGGRGLSNMGHVLFIIFIDNIYKGRMAPPSI